MLSVLVFWLEKCQQCWAGRRQHDRISVLVLLLFSSAIVGANGQLRLTEAAQGRAELWQEVAAPPGGAVRGPTRASRRYRLDKAELAARLQQAPREFTAEARRRETIITLPLPEGGYERFRLEESPVLAAGLAARFPEIKSYRGQALGRAATTMRCDWSPRGLHAVILMGAQTIYLAPDSADGNLYLSSLGEALQDTQFQCLVEDRHKIRPGAVGPAERTSPGDRRFLPVGSTLRTYRLAIAATWEYCNAYGGGTNAGTVASLNTWLNAANAIYEREFAVHLNLVNDTDVLYTTERGFTAATDPYDNANVSTLLNQVRPNLRDNVGQGNYDLGHVFGYLGDGLTGGSGVAYIGVVCDNSNYQGLGPIKGGGASRLGGTAANSTALGVWVHELGHQFGSNHNFNGTQGNCGNTGQRNPATAYESGGGSTIMAYSSICGSDNVTNTRDMRFHSRSFEQITNYIISSTGATCAATTATGNNIPTINAGPDYTIPKNTPFTLTAVGSDADAGDTANLTYVWEQIDSGGTNYFQNGASASYNDAADPATTTRPIFRAFPVATSPSRTFPSLTYILNNANDPPDTVGGLQTAEELPRIGRTLNFRATIRDNRSGAGGVSDDSVALTVDGASGPFLVTAPNSAVTWTGGTLQTVTWSVNNTNVAPVNCANVKISLSTDGGNTFPHVLAASTPNDGSETIAAPNGLSSTTARVKVEAIGNVFFDIGDANFTLTPGDPCATISNINPASGAAGAQVVITGANFTGVTAVAFFNNVPASFTINSSTQITATVPAGATTGPITLSETGCPNSQTATFTVNSCLSVSGIAPNNGPPGFNVVITGGNFTGVTAVKFQNNVAAAFTIVSDTQLNATVPAGAATGPITLSKTNCTDVQTGTFTVPPFAGALSLKNAASYSTTEVAVEAVVAAFGNRLAAVLQSATTAPLPFVVADTSANVQDSAGVNRAAGVYFVAPDRANLQIPAGTAAGTATITISNPLGYSSGTIPIATTSANSVAPGLFAADGSGAGVMKGYAIRTNGATQTIEQVAQFNPATCVWVATPLAQPTNQVTLVLLGTGFRQRTSLGAVSANIGGTPVTVVSAGAAATIGFDELRLQLPALTSGLKDIAVAVDGKAANIVRVQIQ